MNKIIEVLVYALFSLVIIYAALWMALQIVRLFH